MINNDIELPGESEYVKIDCEQLEKSFVPDLYEFKQKQQLKDAQ